MQQIQQCTVQTSRPFVELDLGPCWCTPVRLEIVVLLRIVEACSARKQLDRNWQIVGDCSVGCDAGGDVMGSSNPAAAGCLWNEIWAVMGLDSVVQRGR
jgi:hypothetical protein